MNKKDFKAIVRIANTDIDGNKRLDYALTKIKGVSYSFASAICNVLNLDKNMKAGYLTENDVEKINDLLKNPRKYNIPSWMLNLRKELFTGEDKHLIGHDINIYINQLIRLWSRIKTYKGIRHMKGLPVRGQRTKAHFRKNRGKPLGVMRNKR